MADTLTITKDEVYEFPLDERKYLIQFISVSGCVSSKIIFAKSFEGAYKFALRFKEVKDCDRIITLKEIET